MKPRVATGFEASCASGRRVFLELEIFGLDVGQLDPNDQDSDCLALVHDRYGNLNGDRLRTLIELDVADVDVAGTVVETRDLLFFVALPKIGRGGIGCDVGASAIGQECLVVDRFIEVDQALEILSDRIFLERGLERGVVVRLYPFRVDLLDLCGGQRTPILLANRINDRLAAGHLFDRLDLGP